MEILVYVVLPCLGSIFLVGSMFYGAYRIAGQPKLNAVSWGLMAAYTAANLEAFGSILCSASCFLLRRHGF